MIYPLEYEICRLSFFYFIEKFLKIELREHQVNDMCHIINMEHGNHYDINANRGDGTTTTIVLAALWTVLFNKNIKVAICGNNVYSLKSIIGHIDEWYLKFQENIPENDRSLVITDFKLKKYNFSNNSELHFISDIKNGLRGMNFEYIFLDNTIHCPTNHAFMYNRVVNVKTS